MLFDDIRPALRALRRAAAAPKLWMRAALILCLAVLPGCFESTGIGGDLVGDYTLYSVNGEPAPFLVGESEGHNVEVLEGHVIVRSDQTCEFGHTFRLTSLSDGLVTDRTEKVACTWSFNDFAIHLKFSDGGSISGARARDSLWFDYLFEQGAMRFGYFRGNPDGIIFPPI